MDDHRLGGLAVEGDGGEGRTAGVVACESVSHVHCIAECWYTEIEYLHEVHLHRLLSFCPALWLRDPE